jgi:chaperonin GroEL
LIVARPRPSNKRKKPAFQKPGVVFQPEAQQGLKNGVNQIANAIRPTLGPFPRWVGIDRVIAGSPPELLDSGGTIARRIIQLPGRDQDVGAMFTRHMLWKLQEKVGDGTATAVVIFQQIYNLGARYLATGGNAMRLRTFLDEGVRIIDTRLSEMVTPLRGKNDIAHQAETVCFDRELADTFGEVFEIIGPYGRLEIRNGKGRDLRKEYVQGVYWEEGVLSKQMIKDIRNGRTVVEDGAVLITDLEIKEAEDIYHVMELAHTAQIPGILLLALSISDIALSVILNHNNWEKVKILAVKTPGSTIDAQTNNLTDLSVLTGGKIFLRTTQDSLKNARIEDFGHARKVWAYADSFGVTNGKGDPRLVRTHIQSLQHQYRNADEPDDRDKLMKRIGRLMGGSATLWIGALTEADYKAKKELAERTTKTLRAAMIDGVLPGGGTALLATRSVLVEKMHSAKDTDERAAYSILLRSIEEPFRTLMENAGYEPGYILSCLDTLDEKHGFDLRRKSVVDVYESGLLDPAGVLKEAVHSAVSSAGLLLTTDVLVHRKNPPEALHT